MNRTATDSGNVLIEFISIALLLIIPITYVAFQTAYVARTYVALTSISSLATRAFVIQPTDQRARQIAALEIARELRAQHLTKQTFRTSITCTQSPCISPGGFVTLALSGKVKISVPFIKAVEIPLKSSQTLAVDGYK